MTQVNTKELIKALEVCKKVAGGKQVRPILSTAKYDAESEGLYATDLEVYVCIDIDLGPHSFTMPINEALKAAKSQSKAPTVEIVPDGTKVSLGVVQGLENQDHDEFPCLPEKKGEAYAVTRTPKASADFLKATEAVLYATSADINKKILNGVMIRPEGPHNVVATDSHRAAMEYYTFPTKDMPQKVIPSKAVAVAQYVWGGKKPRFGGVQCVTMWPGAYTGGYIEYTDTHVWVGARMLEGTFPEIDRVIAEKHFTLPHTVVLPQDVIDQLAPAYALSNDKYLGILLECNGTVKASMNVPGVGEWEGTVKYGTYNFNPANANANDGMEAGYNFRVNALYLRDICKSLGSAAVITTCGREGAPLHVHSHKGVLKSILMPMMK